MIDPAQLETLYNSYSKERVEEALKYLSYHNPDPLPKTELEGYPILYVFRHGQTNDNANFIFSGWREAELTETGEQQALTLAEKLKTKKIDMLISSPQIRAVQTMKLAISLNIQAKNLEINTDPRIKERDYGDWTGTSKLEFHLNDPEGLENVRRDYHTPPPNGESIEMVCKRVANFCNEIVPLMKDTQVSVAISCHGNSIRGFRQYFERLSNDVTATIETPLGQDYAAYTIK